MADLTELDFRRIVRQANLAPSVHNTQPVRWQYRAGKINVYADLTKALAVGDPQMRDLGISCGAAVEATGLALSALGIGCRIEDIWNGQSALSTGRLRHCAAIHIEGDAPKVPLADSLEQRFTWRGKFEPVGGDVLATLEEGLSLLGHGKLLTERNDINTIASLNDAASVRVLRDRAYREELLSYMRLDTTHPDWFRDGMNRTSLGLSAFEGRVGAVLLRHPWFEIAARLGLAGAIVSEKDKTRTASAVFLLFSPKDETPLSAGRRFLTSWLEMTRIGLVAWPMAVLADDPEANARCREMFSIPDESELINAFRIGFAPPGAKPDHARFPPECLITA